MCGARAGFDSTVCRMRLFVKAPQFEYFPYDNFQAVPFSCDCSSQCAPVLTLTCARMRAVCRLRVDARLLIAAPFGGFVVDPTRRVEPSGLLGFLDRSAVEMYHYTFVRADMRVRRTTTTSLVFGSRPLRCLAQKKLMSVSNKANYDNAKGFLEQFERWKSPADGVIHPHPHIGAQYTHIRECPNYFNIDLDALCQTCYLSDCKSHRKVTKQ